MMFALESTPRLAFTPSSSRSEIMQNSTNGVSRYPPFQRMPPELHMRVAELTDDVRDRRNLALTCTSINASTRSFIHRVSSKTLFMPSFFSTRIDCLFQDVSLSSFNDIQSFVIWMTAHHAFSAVENLYVALQSESRRLQRQDLRLLRTSLIRCTRLVSLRLIRTCSLTRIFGHPEAIRTYFGIMMQLEELVITQTREAETK